MAILRIKKDTAYRRDFAETIYYYIGLIDDRLVYGAGRLKNEKWMGSIYDIDFFTGHVANQMNPTKLTANQLSLARRATIAEALK